MQHLGFILASYLSTAIILGILALWLLLDHNKQKSALKALEARGVRRRSSTTELSRRSSDAGKQVTE